MAIPLPVCYMQQTPDPWRPWGIYDALTGCLVARYETSREALATLQHGPTLRKALWAYRRRQAQLRARQEAQYGV